MLNICAGGETLLEESIVPILYELLKEGHYVSVITNGTIKRNVIKLAEFPKELKQHLFLKISFHYGELKRTHQLEIFFDTIKMVQAAGISFSVELPAYDGLISENQKIMELCKEKIGAVPHVAVLRDERKSGFSILSEHSFSELNTIWGVYHSKLFQIRAQEMKKKHRGFCYAGDWAFTANLESGEIHQCFHERVIGNLYQKAELMPAAVGEYCHSEYCYVCHAFLTLGVIPDLEIDTYYDEVRDREEADWLQKEMKLFMHQKLFENNKEYSDLEKDQVNERNRRYETEKYESPSDFSHRVMLAFKNQSFKNNYSLIEARHSVKLMYKELPAELLWLHSIYNGKEQGKQLKDTVPITITALEKSSEKAQGDEIWIVGVLADDVYYDAEDIFEHSWLKRYRMLGWRSYENPFKQKVITGYIPKGKKKQLILEKNRWRGLCKIQYREQEMEIDTFGDSEDDLFYIFLDDIY